ncbi:enoyl-CoA hydratase/isomerase family protein [Bacteriovoracaceae bacterium]|nr:enoyl-CoA hydratase/isomerase family protein [Bacteriovoracaceae bacterium]
MSVHINEKADNLFLVNLENEKLNVLDTNFLNEITDTFMELKSNNDCHGVTLTGNGNCFSAGINLKKVFTSGDHYLFEFMDALDLCFRTLFEFPKPVIGAINGHALAGGCIIAACCDYKIAVKNEKAKIGITELAVGVPFPSVPLEIMRFILPPKYMQEVFYFAKGYSFLIAQKYGLVDELTSAENLIDFSLKYAKNLARIPNETFSRTKAHLREDTVKKYTADKAKKYDLALRDYWASEEQKNVIEKFLNSLKK